MWDRCYYCPMGSLLHCPPLPSLPYSPSSSTKCPGISTVETLSTLYPGAENSRGQCIFNNLTKLFETVLDVRVSSPVHPAFQNK